MSNPLILKRMGAFWNSPKSSKKHYDRWMFKANSIFNIARTITWGHQSKYVEKTVEVLVKEITISLQSGFENHTHSFKMEGRTKGRAW